MCSSSIVTDTGWKIIIDRGLDIFQKYESGPFSLEQALQEARLTRGVEVTYIREERLTPRGTREEKNVQ